MLEVILGLGREDLGKCVDGLVKLSGFDCVLRNKLQEWR